MRSLPGGYLMPNLWKFGQDFRAYWRKRDDDPNENSRCRREVDGRPASFRNMALCSTMRSSNTSLHTSSLGSCGSEVQWRPSLEGRLHVAERLLGTVFWDCRWFILGQERGKATANIETDRGYS